MKQALPILFILLFSSSITFAQKKDSVVKKSDSLTADTKFISANDLYRLSDTMKDKATARQYEAFIAIMNEIIQAAVKEYYDKLKSPKKIQ